MVDAQPGPRTRVQTRACEPRPSRASASTGPQVACPALLPAFPITGAERGRWCHEPGSCSGPQFPLVPSGGWRGPLCGWRGGLGGSVRGPAVTVLCLLPPPPLRGQDPLPEFRASVGGLGGQDQCRERGAHPEDVQQGQGHPRLQPTPQPAWLRGDQGKSPKPGTPAPPQPRSMGKGEAGQSCSTSFCCPASRRSVPSSRS